MNKINEFFTLYLTEAIAFIVVVILILLYVIIKQGSDKPKDLKEHEEVKEEQKPIHIFSDVQKETADTDETHEIDEPEEIPEEKIQEEISTDTKPAFKTIKKRRQLTSHGQITKDSFNIFAGAKILVAEDNLINQKVINGILGDSGMHVVIANDGQEALDILKEDKDFSIVLMDAHMPIVDGFEATRQIREDSSLDNLLVVALSGDTASDDIRKMTNVGMQEHLEKPLKMDKLYEIIYSYIDLPGSDDNEEETVNVQPPKQSAQEVLNVDEGIEICGGDNELYKEVLSEFMTMYKDADQKIKSFMAKDQIDSVKRLLLDISGISANIGADILADVSTEFREVLNNKQEEKFFEIEAKFQETLSKVVDKIETHMH